MMEGAAMRFAQRAAAAAVRRARRLLPRRPRPVILMYHRIAEDPFDPWGLAVTPANFADQLAWLGQNRNVLPLTDFAERHRTGDLPRDAAAITFDDGYESVAKAAAPLLERHRLPATVFLPVQLVEQREAFWWDELQRIVFVSDAETLTLDGQEMQLGSRSSSDGDWPPNSPPRTRRQRAFQRIWALLHPKPPKQLHSALERLRSQARGGGWHDPELPMSAEQVRQIGSEALRFGSHALTHPSLPALGADEKRREIAESVSRCAALTGYAPTSFAYPYGDRDEESESLVEEAGFVCACATDGLPVGRRSSLFALPRLGVSNWSGREFGAAIGAV